MTISLKRGSYIYASIMVRYALRRMKEKEGREKRRNPNNRDFKCFGKAFKWI